MRRRARRARAHRVLARLLKRALRRARRYTARSSRGRSRAGEHDRVVHACPRRNHDRARSPHARPALAYLRANVIARRLVAARLGSRGFAVGRSTTLGVGAAAGPRAVPRLEPHREPVSDTRCRWRRRGRDWQCGGRTVDGSGFGRRARRGDRRCDGDVDVRGGDGGGRCGRRRQHPYVRGSSHLRHS